MKTKHLIIVLILCLINSLVGLSQTIENKSDTTINSESDIKDSTQYIIDSLYQNEIAIPDSLLPSNYRKMRSDSLSTDTLNLFKKEPKKEELFTSKIDYNAQDSTVFSLDGQKVFLFGKAEINYGDINLTAGYIEADMENGIVYAEGVLDSVGNPTDEPVFKQGAEEIKAKNITYNLKTKKGYIKGLYSQQDEGYLHSTQTKKEPDNSVNLNRGKYTTCDLENPHFYLWISKGKVVPGKAIISSFAFLVVEDVPLYPLMIPFGFFPSTKEKASGFIIPKFGEEKNRGFYLRDGGYYFAFSDYADLSLKGDVYSKGSWQVQALSQYKLRYKFTGNVNLAYSKIVTDEGSVDANESTQYKIIWSHSQDPKARPNSNFSANVNFSSMGDSKYNATSSQQYLQNTTQSSISFRKTFANTPFNMSMNLNHSQNTRDSIINLTLPNLTLTMARIYPFQRKVAKGKARWYEKVGITYSGNFQNQSKQLHDSVMFTEKMWDYFSYGAKHSVPLSTSFKVLKYFNVSPGMSFTDRMYFKRDIREYQTDSTYEDRTEKGFFNIYDYNYSVGVGTTAYGMYQFKGNWLKAIRHVVTPSVSMNYRPDFSKEIYGFYITDTNESLGYYDPYRNYSVYGMPGTGRNGSVSFSLNNNLEMKVADNKDTANATKKIKLIESLNIGTGYNLIADSLNWSDINISGRTTIFKGLSVNASGRASLYALSKEGKIINEFERNNTGKLARFTSFNISTGYSFKSTDFFEKKDDKEEKDGDNVEDNGHHHDYDGYDYFDIPWDFRFDYSFNYTKAAFTPKISQSLNFSGSFSLTPKWKVGFRSGWDFIAKDFSYTSFNLSRDLHCWMATVNIIPFGQRQSYTFSIGVKSSVLQDLKYDKSKTWLDNYAY